jgi:hypothetical protein
LAIKDGPSLEMNQIFAECRTLKKTSSGQGSSFGKPTAYDLEEELIASSMVSARRDEVVTRKALTHPLRHDSLFVVMKTKAAGGSTARRSAIPVFQIGRTIFYKPFDCLPSHSNVQPSAGPRLTAEASAPTMTGPNYRGASCLIENVLGTSMKGLTAKRGMEFYDASVFFHHGRRPVELRDGLKGASQWPVQIPAEQVQPIHPIML